MVFLRNGQLRYTGAGGEGTAWAFSLEVPDTVVDIGKLSEVDPALGAGIVGDSRRPNLVGSLRIERPWGHAKAAAIWRQAGYRNSSAPSGDPSGYRDGYGINLSGALRLSPRDGLSGALAAGQAIASYMNDGGVDLAPDAQLRARAVPSLGWFAWWSHQWNAQWRSSLGASQHRQDNTAGQAGNALRAGSYASANLLYAPAEHLLLGGEYAWGRRENKDGGAAGDHHLQLSLRLSF